MLFVSELFIYPIKSLRGVKMQEALVTDRGLEHDRRWMLVNSDNRFLSQREVSAMALLDVALCNDHLKIEHSVNTGLKIDIPFAPQTDGFAGVTIWDDICTGQFVGDKYDDWFSEVLKVDCRLVYMPDETQRITDSKYVSVDKITSFSDAYPFLIVGQASVDDLNQRLEKPIGINRFRPNIVFSGGFPYQEDTMASFKIGDVDFNGVKLCARCPIPNIDPETAFTGKEPIKTLAGYRNHNNKVYFGQNLISQNEGIIRIGDLIEVLEVKPMPNSF